VDTESGTLMRFSPPNVPHPTTPHISP
jgi:hypothetical protein